MAEGWLCQNLMTVVMNLFPATNKAGTTTSRNDNSLTSTKNYYDFIFFFNDNPRFIWPQYLKATIPEIKANNGKTYQI